MPPPLRVGALISGGGTNLQAIIDAFESGAIDGHIAFVGTDNPGAPGLDRARSRGLATFIVDYSEILRRCRRNPAAVRPPSDFNAADLQAKQRLLPADADPLKTQRFLFARAVAEARLLDEMKPYTIDLLVLAGFMRVLTPYLIDRISPDPGQPRIMNIHPALLPAFPGTDGYGDTFRYGCKVGGCTVHFVDYGEDSGPIIGQKAFAITPGDTLETIRQKGLEHEWRLYPECIRLFQQDRLRVAAAGDPAEPGRRVVHILPGPAG